MIKTVILILAMSFGLSFFAQPPSGQVPKIGKISGLVLDEESEDPISYATITIKNVSDSLVVTGGLSDEKGIYNITEIPLGEFIIDISFIGYGTEILGPISITREQSKHDLGQIKLGVDGELIEGVVVEGEAPPVRYEVDKKIYNADKIKAAEGGTAKDVLQEIPSITVDNEQNIQLRGSGDVRILVNGRPSSFDINTLLEQIPQKNIKEIEIITNPSAKYDAEGEAGIINIILKNNDLQGFTGSVNASAGTEGKYNAGANFAYRVNKWNLSTSYNYNRFADDFFRDNTRTLTGETILQVSDENRDFVRAGHFVRLGVDYYLDDNNTIFVSGSLNDGTNENETDLLSQNIFTSLFNGTSFTNNGVADYMNYNRLSNQDGNRGGYDLNASFQHIFKGNQSHNMLFDVNYSDNERDEFNTYSIDQFTFLDGSTENGFSDSDFRDRDPSNLQISLDYTNPFDSKNKLELGLRSQLEDRDETFTVQYNNIIDALNTGVFDFSQDIYAGYFTFERQLNEKLGVKGGLRTEYTEVSSIASGGSNVTYEDDYLEFFPSASASYKVTDEFQLRSSYSRRISRPRGRQLNPFADRTDQNNLFVGNNELRPQFTDSYEIGFNQFWKTLSLDGAVYHRNLSDQISYVSTFNSVENINEVSFFNLTRQVVYGAEATFDYDPKDIKWFSTRLSGNYNYSEVKDNDAGITLNNQETSIYNLNIRNNFRFDKGWSGQLNANYQGPFDWYFGQLEAMWGINANASKRILDNKGSVFVRANDIFNTFELNVDLEDTNRTQNLTLDWPSQMAFVGFNYNFGNLKSPQRRKMQRRQDGDGDDGPSLGL